MIIYELTNKYVSMEELIFSKYYATQDQALNARKGKHEIYKVELNSLGREEIASILSMNHVRIHYENGWNEIHDISYITKNEEKLK